MKRPILILVLALTTVPLGTGCSTTQGVSNPVYWGATGTTLGAGGGALIGSIIKNGDITASALLGGTLGVVSGILVGYALDRYEQERRDAIQSELRANQEAINQRQRQIEELRIKIDADSQRGTPDIDRREWIYDGPTLGQYIR